MISSFYYDFFLEELDDERDREEKKKKKKAAKRRKQNNRKKNKDSEAEIKNEEAPKMNGIHVDEFDDQDEEENKGLKTILILAFSPCRNFKEKSWFLFRNT